MALPTIKAKMAPETRKLLSEMKNLITVGELSFSAGIAADIIAEEARQLAPLGPTGNLKRGIVSRVDKTATQFGHSGAAYVWVDYSIAPHAHLVEFGARGGNMPAHPFMRPAVDSKQTEALRAIEIDLANRITRKMK